MYHPGRIEKSSDPCLHRMACDEEPWVVRETVQLLTNACMPEYRKA